jgi:TonB family protein
MRSIVLWGLLCACGGAEKKETVPSEPSPGEGRGQAPPAPDEEEPGDIEVQGLLGRLEPSQIQPVVERHWSDIETCYRTHIGRHRFIGGHVELKFRVNRDGTVKRVHVLEGDLGAWPVEKCVLEVAQLMMFPKPKGGEAELQFPIDFPGRGSVAILAEAGADAELQPHFETLEECAEAGRSTRVRLTVYTGPGGAVKSAGFVAPDGSLDPAWADCAEKKILTWKLTDPRGKVMKATSWYPAASN